MRRHLGRLVDTEWLAPLTTNGTFEPQVCSQLLPGGFAAASCFYLIQMPLARNYADN